MEIRYESKYQQPQLLHCLWIFIRTTILNMYLEEPFEDAIRMAADDAEAVKWLKKNPINQKCRTVKQVVWK